MGKQPRIYTQYMMAILAVLFFIQAVINYNATTNAATNATAEAGWLLLLASLFIASSVCSLIFWSDDRHGLLTSNGGRGIGRRTVIHFADAMIARICFVLFTFFFMCVKRNVRSTGRIVFVLILMMCGYAIYRSDTESTKVYRGRRHIYYHQLFHIFASIGVTMTFWR